MQGSAAERSGCAYFHGSWTYLLRKGPSRLVFIEAYFDETNTHLEASMHSMAGYVFEKDKAVLLQNEWQPMLNKFGLPFFHMVECAHGNGLFKGISRENRILIETNFIELVEKYAETGIAVSFDNRKFKATFGENEFIRDYFSFFCGLCMAAVRSHTDKRPDVEGVAYFFERGNANQASAESYIQRAMASPSVCEAHKYSNHAFIPKEHCAAIQAADMLAWLHGKAIKDLGVRPTRKDYIALTEKVDTNILIANKKALRNVRSYFRRLTAQVSLSYSCALPSE